eukprot:1657187-Karenia_brevis.AAC.1
MKPAKSKLKKRRVLPSHNPGFLSKVKNPRQRQLPSDGILCKMFFSRTAHDEKVICIFLDLLIGSLHTVISALFVVT